MRLNSKKIPSNIRILHSINYKKIISKATDINLDKQESYNFIENVSYKMIKTCLEDGGISLAAPQLGIPKKIIVVKEFIDQNTWNNHTDYFNVYINPTIIVNNKSNQWEFNESCLSVPGYSLPIKRFNEISISFWSFDLVDKKFVLKTDIVEGYLARVLLHEYDHLLGISILDRYKKQKQ